MTNNWRDILTNYSPAYDANDWAALNGRLQVAPPLSTWKKGILITLLAALLFTSGFLVRGLFIREPHTSALSTTTGNNQGDYGMSQTTMFKAAQESGPEQKPSNAQGAPVFGTDENNELSSVLPVGHSNEEVLPTNPGQVSDRPSPQLKTFGERWEKTESKSSTHTATFAQEPATSVLTTQAFKERIEYSGNTTESILETMEGAVTEYSDSSEAKATASIDSAEALKVSLQEAQHFAEEDTEGLKSVQTPEMTEIGLTFSPFYQTSWVKKGMLGISIEPEPQKAFAQVHELGVDMFLGKNLYAGLGYGYHFWDKEYERISKYRAHAPFLRIGITVPVLRNFEVMAQAGASVLIESFQFEQQQWIDGSFVSVTKNGTATSNIGNYGLGASYSYKTVHSFYGLIETSGRTFTIGYKYHLFEN